MRLLKQNSTAQPLIFLLVQSADHITGLTGATPTVTLSKSGAAFGAAAGAVTEIANGWYKCAGNATDTGTLGPLVLHATATSADPVDVEYEVVAVDPQSATTFMTGVNGIAPPTGWNLPTYTGTPTIGGTGTLTITGAVATQAGTLASTTNITAGTFTTATNLTNLPAVPTDWLTAAGVKADAVTKIQAGLSTYAGTDTPGTGTLLTRIGGNLTISGGKAAATMNAADVTGNLPANVIQVASATAFNPFYAGGTISAGATTTVLPTNMSSLPNPNGAGLVGSWLFVIGGIMAGAAVVITGITSGANATITVSPALPTAPINGTTFAVVSAPVIAPSAAAIDTQLSGVHGAGAWGGGSVIEADQPTTIIVEVG